MKQVKELINALNLEAVGMELTQALHIAVVHGSASLRSAVDVLHGIWLGHPLHPALTDVTIGAWTTGLLLDMLGFFTRVSALRRRASFLNSLGTFSAIPTALSGLADYSGIKRGAVGEGTLHGVTNSLALVLHLLAWRARARDKQFKSLLFASAGTGLATFGAWVGGSLVYRLRVGVDHSGPPARLADWTPVTAENNLQNGVLLRVEVEDTALVLVRANGLVYAI